MSSHSHPSHRSYQRINDSSSPSANHISNPAHNSFRRVASSHSLLQDNSAYNSLNANHGFVTPLSDKFSLPPDPRAWGSNLSLHVKEPDDYLHDPDFKRDKRLGSAIHGIVSTRAILNLGCLFLVVSGLLILFIGYPITAHILSHEGSMFGGFNIGGMNASGQIPTFIGNWGLIDNDTPTEVRTKKSYSDPSKTLQLVFSDEFETEGRTFYPGDDPYWEAVDLHYWSTNNLEWYDPSAITTRTGALEITLSNTTENHNMKYTGGMMSTWNKFCFTGGLLEASVTLPGFSNVAGLWPAVWTMGNLGRAGYGATLEGMWPYSYDACDVGTVKNQTLDGKPVAATNNPYGSGPLSYLPGQKLSRCTCKGESHPGPVHSNGDYVGRSAPEIDAFEAQNVAYGDFSIVGQVSQSAQWAPYNANFTWFNTTDNMNIANSTITFPNTYLGGEYQQATSIISLTDQNCYEMGTDISHCFSVYGFEYQPGFDDAYISWVSDGKVAWTIKAGGLAADSRTEISARPIPQEPMYLITNLGLSKNFGDVDFDHLVFPTTMRVDWIRVYQEKDNINIGCNPRNFPTSAYIHEYNEAYTNWNLTTWQDDYKQPFPKNRWLGEC
ncbi:beta-glucan synthesis-associated [Crepidotus variabilis]|uniref:Beta-glucan synthesis-associated n=1 Tax=Crepidotus variabilis TaxID=179855 RepID=A0A9P6JPK7_9AGAR|nr:beta-glucan synthesis-associated [Crepidotus variabilis]